MNEHLYRSRDDRIIAGVAGGLAELWDFDPSIVRIVWALLGLLTGGIFLLIYVIMWIVVPEEGSGKYGASVPPWPTDPAAGSTRPARPRPARPPGSARPAADAQAPAQAAAPAGMDRRAEARQARHAAREARRAARRERGENPAAIVIGAILIIIGALFFVQQFLPNLDIDLFWPLLLVGLGILVLVIGFSRDSGTKGSPP